MRSAALAFALAVCACVAACVQSPTEVLVEKPEGPDVAALVCPEPVVDGAFTGWDGTYGLHEYADSCGGSHLEGRYGTVFVRVEPTEGYLYVLNDWQLQKDTATPPTCYNLFILNLAGEVLEIRLFGDDRIEVTRGGEVIDAEAAGATGFGTSPMERDVPHALYEFRLPVSPGTFTMFEKDPMGGSVSTFCDDDDDLVEEPTILKGVIDPEGAITLEADPVGPFVTRVVPTSVATGDEVRVEGVRFGVAKGAVRVGSSLAGIVEWSDREVRLVVPRGVGGDVPLRVFAPDGTSEPVTLHVACEPDCDGRVCGTDGCDGSCGACGEGETCEAGGCVCEPDCDGRECGADGCDGSCGACAPGDACVDGQCECVPQCEGKECGDDACGGLCGQCPIGQECTKIGLCAQP